ncbi:MAG: magnesium transporter [Patescibacteria group bacterium]|nr:magnesium transporter [Patescibacteria group bacterium]
MIIRNTTYKITWVNIVNPTEEDINQISEEFLLPREISHDIVTPTLKPGAKVYENAMYIVQHFPNILKEKNKVRRQEVDFILGDHWIISISYSDINSILDLNKIYQLLSSDGHHTITVGGFYVEAIKTIYKKSESKLDDLDVSLDTVEKNIYNGHERKMVTILSQKMRDIINFEHTFTMHDTILLDVASYGKTVYGPTFVRNMNNLHTSYLEIMSRVRFLKDAFREFQNTNDSLLNHKTADAMKTLTMMSFVIFPLSLVASIFGMNAKNIPIIGYEHDFEIIIVLMLLMSVGFFVFFKYKKWL